MTDKPRIFVSFSNRDAAMAIEWVMVLRHRGIRVFCSYEDIKPGDDWNEKLRKAIIDCDELILLCSPEAIDSEWVLMKIGAAWALGKRITPILLAGEVEQLPDHLRRIQFARLDSVADLERLIEQICDRHGQEVLKTAALPFAFELSRRNETLPPLNDSPPITVTTYQPNWVRCPCCKKAFSIQNKQSWDGTCHITCGQRLVVAQGQRNKPLPERKPMNNFEDTMKAALTVGVRGIMTSRGARASTPCGAHKERGAA